MVYPSEVGGSVPETQVSDKTKYKIFGNEGLLRRKWRDVSNNMKCLDNTLIFTGSYSSS